jgi:hypothetical protein
MTAILRGKGGRREIEEEVLMHKRNAVRWEKAANEGVAIGAAAERERLRGLTNPKADEFLTWIADRVVHVYGESDMVDFVHALRRLAAALAEGAE